MEINLSCNRATRKYILRFIESQSLVYPVAINMILTLVSWIGIYEMKLDEKVAFAMFGNYGESYYDAMMNGLGASATLVFVAFFMLTFAMWDFRKIVQFWLYASAVLLLFVISSNFFYSAIIGPNVTNPTDLEMFWVGLATGLYGVVGMCAYFTYHLPESVHRFYVICNCSLVSQYYLRCLPGHTAWVVLVGVAVWDLFAVLSPLGPLNMAQKKAGDYNGNLIRFLMFNASKENPLPVQVVTDCSDSDSSSEKSDSDSSSSDSGSDSESESIAPIEKPVKKPTKFTLPPVPKENHAIKTMKFVSDLRSLATPSSSPPSSSSDSSTSVASSSTSDSSCSFILDPETATASDVLNDSRYKLGMGDFVFYSLLVGKAAASGSILGTLGAFIGVIYGLMFTLIFFSSNEKTIPALPISILLGITMYLMGLQAEPILVDMIHPIYDLYALGFEFP